jgi:hypothetical protein
LASQSGHRPRYTAATTPPCDASEHRDDHRVDGQLYGDGQGRADHLGDRGAGAGGAAEVAGERVAHEVQVLHGQRLVEPELGPHRGERRRVGLLPRHRERRVAGQGADADEHDDRREHERHDGLPEPVEQVAGHVSPPDR